MSLAGVLQPVLRCSSYRAVGQSHVQLTVDAGVPPVALPANAIVFQKTATLAGGASATLDLTGGGLVDDTGQSTDFAKVYAYYIAADAGNVNDVILGAAANPWTGPIVGATGTQVVPPGGWNYQWHPGGWTVTAGAADQLKIANGGGGTAVTYKLILVGVTA